MATSGQRLLQLADLLNDDLPAGCLPALRLLRSPLAALLLVGFRHHAYQIRVIPGLTPQAVIADATGVAVGLGIGAQHAGCQRFGENAFTAAGRTGEQQRMGHAFGPVDGSLPQGRLPFEDHWKHCLTMISATAARIASGLALASTTLMRCGAAAARLR